MGKPFEPFAGLAREGLFLFSAQRGGSDGAVLALGGGYPLEPGGGYVMAPEDGPEGP